MANKTQSILIESILGGQAPFANFSRGDQFRASLGIDPSLPRTDSSSATSLRGSGLLRPSPSKKISSTTIGEAPMWIIPNPKLQVVYVYDYNGSVYSALASSPYTVTALSDGGTMTGSRGNGAAYYDNYIYFAKATTVARYGPLNGTPEFNGDYWVTTLGKTMLDDSALFYPNDVVSNTSYPNHILHRHSNGNLYILDTINGEGVLHYISTKKTTVEGDTDNGSTYDMVGFGYGFYPSAIESYGDSLVIALFEAPTSGLENNSKTKAKLVLWDTTSQNITSISNDEFPDQFISAMKNINGNLYIVSGNIDARGFRVSQYIGGNSIQEIFFSEDGHPSFAGAIDNNAGQLILGSDCLTPEESGCVYALGLHKPEGSSGFFNIMRSTGGTGVIVTACKNASSANFSLSFPWVGWSNGTAGGTNNGIDVPSTSSPDYATAPQVWWSQVYRIGKPFKITRIRIPLEQTLTSGVILTPSIYLDGGTAKRTLTDITSTNFGLQTQMINIRPTLTSGGSPTADNSFWLELKWTGTALCTVSLPITIEYELLDIDSAFP